MARASVIVRKWAVSHHVAGRPFRHEEAKGHNKIMNKTESVNGSTDIPSPGRSPSDLVDDIVAGLVHVKSLSKPNRAVYVEALSGEGYGPSEMAKLLRVTSKTIGRDICDLRAKHAVERSPKFVKETVGNLVRQADLTVRRLRRTVRREDTDPRDAIYAERECWQIWRELMEVLQKLGYLPTAALEVHGDITHQVALQVPSYQQLQEELGRIEKIQATSEEDEEAVMRLRSMRTKVERLAVAEEIQLLSVTKHEEQTDDRI